MLSLWLIAGALALAFFTAYRLGWLDGFMVRVAVALTLWLAFGSTAVWAAGASSSVNGSILFQIAQPWLEIVEPILMSFLIALSVYAAAYVRTRWGIDLSRFDLEKDAAHRAALNTALQNAAGGVIQRLGSASAALNINVGNPLVAEFAKRVAATVPAAVEHFGYGPADLEQKILNKIPQVLPIDPIATPPAAAVIAPASQGKAQ